MDKAKVKLLGLGLTALALVGGGIGMGKMISPDTVPVQAQVAPQEEVQLLQTYVDDASKRVLNELGATVEELSKAGYTIAQETEGDFAGNVYVTNAKTGDVRGLEETFLQELRERNKK
jgi:hypothetical protein